MEARHGGDIYRNDVKIDFSVNVNPLGIPEEAEAALYEAVGNCGIYPDIDAQALKKAVSNRLQISEEYLLFGNGASELLFAIVHGIRPKKTLIPIPSFGGYEYAAGAIDGEVIYYETKEENAFCIGKDFFEFLTQDVDLLFLANPNNPTGNVMSREMLVALLHCCREMQIVVVLDECFIEFCDGAASMLEEIGEYENLIIVRAFTKIFAIPGVRLGYLICSNALLLGKIKRQIPEWNLSVFAQAAGCACMKEKTFIEKTKHYIKKERMFLEKGLIQAGMKVFPGTADFLLIYSKIPLYERLLEKKILIRDCENFKGLSKGFYRIAVKSRKENEILLNVIGEMNETDESSNGTLAAGRN